MPRWPGLRGEGQTAARREGVEGEERLETRWLGSGLKRRWNLRIPKEFGGLVAAITGAYPALARSRDWLGRLLANRGVREPEGALAFLEASLSKSVRSPLLMKDMGRAAMRLGDAVRGGEPIVVFGDYDVDGISGSAQLLTFFREIGVEVRVYVPNRLREGYGLNEAAVRQFAADGARIVISVDCGSANIRELTLASALGLDVIVCDHHHLPAGRPPAFAVLNPLQPDCPFPFKGLSGAGVVFYLLMGLRAELRERGVDPLPDLRRYLDLVALGTVADVMPLRDENRVFVKYGLGELDRTSRPGIVALREMTSAGPVSVRTVGFRLAPLLNACGRLSDARSAVELLTTESLTDARAALVTLDSHNRERQALQRRMLGEAIAMVEADRDWRRRASIVVGSPDWHPGVVGIVAARLAERYYRPTFVMSLSDSLARGSGRSIPGVHLVETLRECGAPLLSFGGHQAAAGVTLRSAEVGSFAAALERRLREQTRTEDFVPQLEIDGEISLGELTPELMEDLEALEPTGPANPAPVLLSRRVQIVSRRDVGAPIEQEEEQQPPHMKLLLRQEGVALEAIGFQMSSLHASARERIDVVFSPVSSDWGGRRRVELRMLDLRPAE